MSKLNQKTTKLACALPRRLPPLALPPTLFGPHQQANAMRTLPQQLRQDFRRWLLEWLENTHNEFGELPEGNDCNTRIVDLTLWALAPLFIELLAPRVGSPVRAAKIIARRFKESARQLIHFNDPEEVFSLWWLADDVNHYDENRKLISWPRPLSSEKVTQL